MNCLHCGAALSAQARFCQSCGQPTQATPSSSATPQASPELLLGTAIGGNAGAYLDAFLDREQGRRGKLGWHWPAFFATFFWMLYRKMFGLAFAYLGIALVVVWVLLPLLAVMGGSAGTLLGLAAVLALFVLPALFAEALYHRQCRRNIELAQRLFPHDLALQLQQIQRNGGTSAAGYIVPIVAAGSSVPIIGILAAIAIPAYQDYTQRAQMQQVYQELRRASLQVGEYYREQQQLPANLADSGFRPHTLPGQGSVDFAMANDGTLSARIVRPGRDPGSLLLTPRLDGSGGLQWQCSSPDIPRKHLPNSCRD